MTGQNIWELARIARIHMQSTSVVDWRKEVYCAHLLLRRLYSRSTAQIYLHYENYKQHWNSHDSLKNTIRSILLPVLLNGYSRSDMERNLFSLPAKFVAVWAYSNLKKDARLSMPIHPIWLPWTVVDVKEQKSMSTQTSSKHKRRSSVRYQNREAATVQEELAWKY